MNIHKFLLVGAVALTGVLFVPSAQANDHRHHDGGRHEYHHYAHGYYARPYSYGYARPDYYYGQPTVIYDEPYFPNRYYAGPSYGLTFAFGGHSRQRYHRHH